MANTDRRQHPRIPQVLRVDASGRRSGSVSRSLADEFISALEARHGALDVRTRDLAQTPPGFVDETWITASYTLPPDLAEDQRAALRESDDLVTELQAADLLVIATPVYNFGVPAALKAWIDMVARARLTFRYTDHGPVGLLHGKRAVLVVASGGTGMNTGVDFASTYLRHVLGFLGISDVRLIAADRLQYRGDEALHTASRQIAEAVDAGPLAATAA